MLKAFSFRPYWGYNQTAPDKVSRITKTFAGSETIENRFHFTSKYSSHLPSKIVTLRNRNTHQYKYGLSLSTLMLFTGSILSQVWNVKPFWYGHLAMGGRAIAWRKKLRVTDTHEKLHHWVVKMRFHEASYDSTSWLKYLEEVSTWNSTYSKIYNNDI